MSNLHNSFTKALRAPNTEPAGRVLSGVVAAKSGLMKKTRLGMAMLIVWLAGALTTIGAGEGGPNNGVEMEASPPGLKALGETRPALTPALSPRRGGDVVFHEVRYEGRVGQEEARFQVAVTAESMSKGEASAILFEGDLAVLPPR